MDLHENISDILSAPFRAAKEVMDQTLDATEVNLTDITGPMAKAANDAVDKFKGDAPERPDTPEDPPELDLGDLLIKVKAAYDSIKKT